MAPNHTNQLLGYPPDARLLIINADDFGMCHSVNEAIIQTLQTGIVQSTTLMVPCPWALHAMQFLAEHPEISFGVHLTVISDWPYYRWGPVTPKALVPTLLNAEGVFHNFEQMPAFLAQVNLAELELEFRAQIEFVLAAGLKPTHLDWHSLRITNRLDIHEVMFKLAKEYGLALRVAGSEWIAEVQRRGLPCNEDHFLDSYMLDINTKAAHYAELLHELPAGLHEWAVHPALDSPELLAIERETNHIRQTDFDFLTSPSAQEIIREEGITLLSYHPLQKVWRNVGETS